MCLLDIRIYLDANKHGINADVVDSLHDEFHRVNGKHLPKSFAELLEVVC